jgi:Tfp pilus assembly protein PilF/predicted  nucleic acid-binding Zn-ribbon protein
MKWLSALIVSLAMLGGIAQAAGPDDQFIDVYNLIQQADDLNKGTNPRLAVEKYNQAKAGLLKIQRGYPNWNSDVIKFRLDYVTDKLNEANLRLNNATSTGATTGAPAPKKATAAELQQQITDLAAQVSALAADKSALEKRLKEALSVQPAATDPNELNKAYKQIDELKKERDLLRLSVEESKANQPEDKKALSKEAKLIKERDALKAELEQASNNIEQLKSQIAASSSGKKGLKALQEQLDDAGKAKAKQAKEIASLQTDLDQAAKDNESLKKQLSKASSGDKGLKALQEKLDDAEKEKAKLQKEIESLKNKLSSKEAKQAAKEKKASAGKEVEQLKARLSVLEAARVEYTPEELALIQKAPVKPEVVPVPAAQPVADTTTPAPATNAPKSKIRSAKDLPPGTSALMSEAQRTFMAHDYEAASKKFSDILRQDENNVYVLSHLASAQYFANHPEDCEKTLDHALSIDSNDAFCLYTKGNLRLSQKKLDEALDLLTRSAAINSTNSAVQNSLGLVLSQKGLTKPAETALRKALQMDPDFPEAHQNLAVVYATQKPPFLELARWHYKKSIMLGQPKNTDLEKLLEAAPAAPTTPTTPPPAADK